MRTFRIAARALARTPGFSLTAGVTLAVGVGCTTAMFSVLHAVVLQPLPYPEPDRLVAVWHRAPGAGMPRFNQSVATYWMYREQAASLEELALWDGPPVQISGVPGASAPRQAPGLVVTEGFLPLLGVRPALGRGFVADDGRPGSNATSILSHGLWQRAFSGDPDVVGRSLTVDGVPTEIVGVLPSGFDFLDRSPEVLTPMRIDPERIAMGEFYYRAVGRLAPGADAASLEAEMEALIPRAVERFPGPIDAELVREVGLAPWVVPLKDDVVGGVGGALWTLFGIVGIVLLVACANVASLFLVRAESRGHEVAVMRALGADRGDVVARFVAEGALLSLAACAAGLGLAAVGVEALLGLAPAELPRVDEVGMRGSVLLFAVGVSLASGVLFSAVPFLRFGDRGVASALRDAPRAGGRRRSHVVRAGLVVGQIAMAVVLLVGSGLLFRTLESLRAARPGFEAPPEEVLIFRAEVPRFVATDGPRIQAMHERILDRLRALPGVQAAGAASAPPLAGAPAADLLVVEDDPPADGALPPRRAMQWILPGYFDALGIPMVAGRDLDGTDVREARPVAVVSEGFARLHWDDPARAVGRRVGSQGPSGAVTTWREIVGVVGDVRDRGVDQPPSPVVYWPQLMEDFVGPEAWAQPRMSFVVRAPTAVLASLRPGIEAAVAQVSGDVPVTGLTTLDELLRRSRARATFTFVILGLASAVALVLGAVGIYGVISFSVGARTREIGVRMALGARAAHLVGRVVLGGLGLAAAGVAVGLAAAAAATRFLASVLFGVAPLDVGVYGAVPVVLLLVAALAAWVPARRAARVDPAITLRSE